MRIRYEIQWQDGTVDKLAGELEQVIRSALLLRGGHPPRQIVYADDYTTAWVGTETPEGSTEPASDPVQPPAPANARRRRGGV